MPAERKRNASIVSMQLPLDRLIDKCRAKFEAGEMQDAFRLLHRAAADYPEDGRVWLFYADVMLETGNTESAYRYAARALTMLGQKNDDCALILSRIAREKGSLRMTLSLLNWILLRPDEPTEASDAAYDLLDEVNASISSLPRQSNRCSVVRMRAADQLRRTGRLPKRMYLRMLRMNGDHSGVYLDCAEQCFSAGKLKEAMWAVSRALRLAPDYQEALLLLAELLNAQKKRRASLGILMKTASLCRNRQQDERLIRASIRMNFVQPVIALTDRRHAENPYQIHLLQRMHNLALYRQDAPQAARLLEQIRMLDPECTELTRIYTMMNRYPGEDRELAPEALFEQWTSEIHLGGSRAKAVLAYGSTSRLMLYDLIRGSDLRLSIVLIDLIYRNARAEAVQLLKELLLDPETDERVAMICLQYLGRNNADERVFVVASDRIVPISTGAVSGHVNRENIFLRQLVQIWHSKESVNDLIEFANMLWSEMPGWMQRESLSTVRGDWTVAVLSCYYEMRKMPDELERLERRYKRLLRRTGAIRKCLDRLFRSWL